MSRLIKTNKLSNSRFEYIKEEFTCSYSIPRGIRHAGHTEVGGKEVNSMFVKLFCLPQTPSRLPLYSCIHFVSMKFPRLCAMRYELSLINSLGVD